MSHDHAPGGGAPGSSEESPKQTTPTSPPPPPIPADDPRLLGQARTPPPLHHAGPSISSQDLFKLSPIAALKLLSGGIEALVRVTGDIPPNAAPRRARRSPTCAASPKRKPTFLLRLHQQAQAQEKLQQQKQAAAAAASSNSSPFYSSQAPIDGVKLRHTPTSPPPPPAKPEPYIVIGANSQPLNLQHSAITRKFYSKAPPPISIEDYLLRMHRFCPMSTAVYLATSLYIFRLAVEERAIPVTRRNCHRLLLAGLRVAMKALEDLSYPHAKVARVGGVSEVELARLEISFCFLAGFELVVGEETLRRHWEALRDGQAVNGGGGYGGDARAGYWARAGAEAGASEAGGACG
ncbi:hypothetical protein PG987_004738 [Apiospora arundinis]